MHYPLTIDFTDASFDNDSIQSPVSPDVDVVFPIVDNPITLDAGLASEKSGVEFNDTRATLGTTAQSIALTPTAATESLMEEFLFEFDNDMDDNGTSGDTGLRVSSAGHHTGAGGVQQVKTVDIVGPIDDLTADGTLDVYVPNGFDDANGNGIKEGGEATLYQKITLGLNSTTKSGDNMAMFVSGDTDGADMGSGNDVAMINVDASATMGGMYQGGSGYDILQLVEGVAQDNGALVDLTRGRNPNEAEVDNYGGEGSGLFFEIGGFEEIQLTDNADVITVAASTGGSDLTDVYDAAYMNPGSFGNSMMKVMTGFTDGGAADTVYVDTDSDLYLSFEFSKEIGINATFKDDGNVDIVNTTVAGYTGPSIEVDVLATGGTTKMAIDYFEATSSQDIVTNNNSIGVTVDLGGSGTNKAEADVFTGSDSSSNDVLDAREAHDLVFTEGNSAGYIHVKGTNELGQAVNADLKSVDYIMVRDHAMTSTVTDGDQIWQQLGTDDVDFYADMTHLINSKIVDGLGSGATDAFGLGYDVITSAQVDSFAGDSNLRVYYEGDHDDFIDTDDIVTSNEGSFVMSAGNSGRGSAWESQISDDTAYGPGQEPGFYIEVGDEGFEKKLAVTFDDVKGAWKVDTTAIQVAEGASSAISGVTRDVDVTSTYTDADGNEVTTTTTTTTNTVPSGTELAEAIGAQFGIDLKGGYGMSYDHSGTVISNDIYLNATEDAIKELMGSGSVTLKASNFDFYTKVDVEAEDGPVTVNVKLGANAGNTAFTLDLADIDVAVESFHNVADVTGAGVSSSSEAGEFVKIDNAADIALGNGGDDTYVVGANADGIYGGTALEYGNIGKTGGLTKSIDAINFNSVDSVADLEFVRTKTRQEADGNSLEISQSDGKGGTTVLFDNYNEFLDFRRVEYLSVEDGANNNEIYEIVTGTNLAEWDNEIYVSHATEGSMDVELGGIDYVIGADGSKDTFNFKLADIISAGSDTSVVNLSNLSSSDGDTLVATDASTYMSDTDKGLLEAALAQGISDGVGEVRFSYDATAKELTLGLDNLANETYNLDLYNV